MAKHGLTNPVDALDTGAENIVDKATGENPEGIAAFSFESVPTEVASKPHPFDGYPEVKVMVKGKQLNLTHWVQYDPSKPIFQDPSGKAHSITDKSGRIIKVVDLKTSHNRVIQSYATGKKAVDVVFETNLEMPDGSIAKRCSYVPDPSVRAQLIFKYNTKTSKVEVDEAYKLADRKQSKRLRELFNMIINPTIKNEALAREITGE